MIKLFEGKKWELSRKETKDNWKDERWQKVRKASEGEKWIWNCNQEDREGTDWGRRSEDQRRNSRSICERQQELRLSVGGKKIRKTRKKKLLWKEREWQGSEDKEGQLSSHLIKKLLMEQTGRPQWDFTDEMLLKFQIIAAEKLWRAKVVRMLI